MAARLTAENPRQSFALRLGCAFVEIERRLPLDLGHVARTMDGKGRVEAVERDLAEAALVNMPRYQDGAFAFGGRTQENAWASGLAIAGFKVRAFKTPRLGHGCYPPLCCRGERVR